MLKVGILGSTGSIGTQTLEVVKHLTESEIEVVGLSAGRSVAKLTQQIQDFKPKIVSIGEKQACQKLTSQFPKLSVGFGMEGLMEIATHPDIDVLVVALVGAVGLKPTLAALKAGKRVALANKETLVIGGHLVMQYRDKLIPIDSEHSALWQCLDGKNIDEVSSLILTASGGPFLSSPRSLDKVTVAEALKHPNWDMGGKITIDSATMMNKGLEVIEAHWLFGFAYDNIEVVIHPESIVHSLIRFIDGSIIGQMATTDMRLPIQYALTHPAIRSSDVPPLDLGTIGCLSFQPPNISRFPCLDLAYQAGKIGGTMPTVLNAANEIAVQQFMGEEIKFLDIPKIVDQAMGEHNPIANPDLETILAVDKEVRERLSLSSLRKDEDN